MKTVTVIGAGLAGCEAAWQLARAGVSVQLYEMKPQKYTAAHHSPGLAELVCSNSLKAARVDSAAGLLKEEMRRFGSLTLAGAARAQVPAGGALAVDREQFSEYVTRHIRSHPRIRVISEEVTALPEGPVIVATGPLTSDALAEELQRVLRRQSLSFFDAAAPIVTAESIDRTIVFAASRYGRGEEEGGDYLNCPMDREEYERFYEELIHAQTAPLHEFDRSGFRVYEGCMPVEVLAKRGRDSIRFGPLKPVGLRDPRTGHRPWAVVQLRRENAEGTLYNLVGFQTNLRFPEQKRVFSLIPGLASAEFARYGVMHRNTFLDSPRLLDPCFGLREDPRVRFAGQMTGVEGYMESAASGIWAGYAMARAVCGKQTPPLPRETMMGALAAYISDAGIVDFQPMGANLGILPPLPETIRDKRLRAGRLAERSLAALEAFLRDIPAASADALPDSERRSTE